MLAALGQHRGRNPAEHADGKTVYGAYFGSVLLPCCRSPCVLPAFLDDHTPEERELALHFGLKFLEGCDALVICGNRISRGMEGEIIHAINCGIDILHYTESHIDRYDFSFFAADRIRRE